MTSRPQADEAAEYYFGYINRVPDGDIVVTLEKQLDSTAAFLQKISEEKSLYRYSPDRWSIREMLNHINDAERIFAYRALWFARALEPALPGFDQDVCAAAAYADKYSWASHLEDFRSVRLATLTMLRNLPDNAWARTGTASDNLITVNAIAYIIAGHVEHHLAVLREKYGWA
jgi:hypothetical protein